MNEQGLYNFVRESNWIEHIKRDPTPAEIAAHEKILDIPRSIGVLDLVEFVSVIQPNARLRDRVGLNVMVGQHVPPAGGPEIRLALQTILYTTLLDGAFKAHFKYESLHPFTDGNGRSGRVLWLWCMAGVAPLGFLHHWYYQSFQGIRGDV